MTVPLKAIRAQMSCDHMLEWVSKKLLKEYKNLHQNRGLQWHADCSFHYVGNSSGGESALDSAGIEGPNVSDNEDDKDDAAETTVCTFLAYNLHKGGNRGSLKPLQQGWKKTENKEPRRIGYPPLSFGELIPAQPQGWFVCYGRGARLQHEGPTCPIQKVDTKAYKKAQESKKRAQTNVRETKAKVSKEELSKLREELAKEI